MNIGADVMVAAGHQGSDLIGIDSFFEVIEDFNAPFESSPRILIFENDEYVVAGEHDETRIDDIDGFGSPGERLGGPWFGSASQVDRPIRSFRVFGGDMMVGLMNDIEVLIEGGDHLNRADARARACLAVGNGKFEQFGWDVYGQLNVQDPSLAAAVVDRTVFCGDFARPGAVGIAHDGVPFVRIPSVFSVDLGLNRAASHRELGSNGTRAPDIQVTRGTRAAIGRAAQAIFILLATAIATGCFAGAAVRGAGIAGLDTRALSVATMRLNALPAIFRACRTGFSLAADIVPASDFREAVTAILGTRHAVFLVIANKIPAKVGAILAVAAVFRTSFTAFGLIANGVSAGGGAIGSGWGRVRFGGGSTA